MIPFIDLKSQYQRVEENVQSRMKKVFEHGKFIHGPEVAELEEVLSKYVGVKHCVGVGNGTDALLIALMALDVESGDEVIVPSFSYVATVEVGALLGVRPVYVDVDPRTFNMSVSDIKNVISAKTKAILPVSLYGQCANFKEINAIASEAGIAVIEDGAQSFGATHHGDRSGALSTIGTTSFFPTKPLGCYGDGGAIFTDSDRIAEVTKQIRTHGQDRRYHHIRIGMNSRLDTLQAAILLEKFQIFDSELLSRQKIAAQYSNWISAVCEDVQLPFVEAHNTSAFAQYTIKVPNRNQLQKKLADFGVPTMVHYPDPLHRQPAFAQPEVDAPVSEQHAHSVLSLPMGPYLEKTDQEKVVSSLEKALKSI